MTNEDYLREHGASGLKVGDKVKVLFKVPSDSRGWYGNWVGEMDYHIGKDWIISSDKDIYGFELVRFFCWIFFALESITPEHLALKIQRGEYRLSPPDYLKGV